MNEAPTPAPAGKGPWTARWRTLADYLGLLAVLAGLLTLFGVQSGTFLSARTFATIANTIPDLLVVAVGMTLVLIAGGIDLSVGSVMALSASVMGLVMARWGWPAWAGFVACLAVGTACGAVNGALTVAWSLPSFIVTLGMLEIARGGAYLVTGSQTVYLGARVEVLGTPLARLGVSPAFLVAVALVVVAQVVLSRTVFGRYLVAIGTNEEAVRLSGIDPRWTKFAAFALAGLTSGVGGLFTASRLAAADPNGAIGLELSAIAAAVIGGTSLMGGRGSVFGTFLGVLIIALLQTGLAQVGASEPAKRVITGAVIVLAVIVDTYRQRRTGRLGKLVAGWLGRPRAGGRR
jgi:ribose transport system permease protein